MKLVAKRFAEVYLKITVLGAGAMGSLFSGYLSRKNDVTVIDVSDVMVKAIQGNGVRIREKDGTVSTGCPSAVKVFAISSRHSELPSRSPMLVIPLPP